jgi:hypothetical protein
MGMAPHGAFLSVEMFRSCAFVGPSQTKHAMRMPMDGWGKAKGPIATARGQRLGGLWFDIWCFESL